MKAIPLASVSMMLIALLGACDKTNSETHILHTKDISRKSLITDAKQRVVWTRKINDGQTILCAEPSPDVAQAFSEAMKLAASLSAENKTADGSTQNVDASGEFARSYAGAVAELGQRLAVTQLLRDEMYRACEAYANGALTPVSYTLKLARLDKKMVTLLSSEIAAGALGRPPVTLGSSADAVGATVHAVTETGESLSQKIAEMKETGLGPEPNDKKRILLEAKEKEAGDLVKSLLSLQRDGTRAAAGASARNVGQPDAGATSGSQQELVDIHKNFLDDTGLEPLMDACVTAMSEVGIGTFISAETIKKRFEEYSVTADFLRESLEGGIIDLDQTVIIQMLPSAEFNDDGDPDEKTRAELEKLLSEAEIQKEKILSETSEGNMFAFKCMDTFMVEGLTEEGFIARMIGSKKDLREIPVKLIKAELQLLNLQTCREAANLLEDKQTRQKALAACVVKNGEAMQ